jgi:glyoxylase-like metal-dependent hydrolase (beta-lactamase superfamily II)
MRIDTTGRICGDFYALGHHATPVYLLDGPMPALFDAGYTALKDLYVRDIEKVLGGRRPAYLFLTHAHFDHIGCAGCFKRLWPELKVLGSEKAREILHRPNAIELIKALNRESARVMSSWGLTDLYEGPFETFDLDLVLRPDQIFEPEPGVKIQSLYTPGHTWDFMSYWLAEQKILVASEAVGCDDGSGYIVSEFLVDFDGYCRSMERLSRLDVRVLCVGHRYLLTDGHAQTYIKHSLEQAQEFASTVERFLLEEQGDVERAVSRVKAFEWDPRPLPKQPEQPYILNTRARVKALRARMLRNIPDLGFPPPAAGA